MQCYLNCGISALSVLCYFSLTFRITLLQKRPIRILHSAAYSDHTCPLFHRYKVLKFVDLISLENCIFVNKCFSDEAFSLFSNHFKLTASSHSYCTRSVNYYHKVLHLRCCSSPRSASVNLLSTQQ